jgi:drug/metabolite transporter (DMT)-like permease
VASGNPALTLKRQATVCDSVDNPCVLSSTSHPSRFSPKVVGLLAAVITVTIWTAFIVIARASADPARGGVLNPFDIVYARILGASLILMPWGLWLTARDRARRSEAGLVGPAIATSSLFGLSPLPLRMTLTIGVFGGLLYGVLAYSGFVYAPAAHASVLMPGSLPLWTALLAVWVLGDRITAARATGLMLIVGGDLLVGGASLLHALDGSGIWRGDVLFMTAAFIWSCYSVLVRKHALDAVRATIAITALAFVVYVPIYTALLLLHWVPGQVLVAPWRDVALQMLFQGVGSVVVSGIAFNKMIQHYGPVRSTMITALVPGLSAIAAVIVLGEPLHWNLVAGLALVTAGIMFGVRRASAVPTVATKSVAAHAISTGAKG